MKKCECGEEFDEFGNCECGLMLCPACEGLLDNENYCPKCAPPVERCTLVFVDSKVGAEVSCN